MPGQGTPSAAPASAPAPGPAEPTVNTAKPGTAAAQPSGGATSQELGGLDLKDLSPRERAVVEKRFRTYQSAVDKKLAVERAEMETVRTKAQDFDAMAPVLRDPRVRTAIGRATGRDDLIDPSLALGETGDTEAEIEIPDFGDDPHKAIRWTMKQAEERAYKRAQKDLEVHKRSLESKFGGEVSRLHEHTRQQEYEKLAVDYADDPEVEANRDEVLSLARKTGMGMRQAFFAVNGETLAERRRADQEEAASTKVERARAVAQDPRSRITRALATSRPKPSNGKSLSLHDVRAWRESQGIAVGAGENA